MISRRSTHAGIAPGTPKAAARRAFRTLVLKYHPDHNKEPDVRRTRQPGGDGLERPRLSSCWAELTHPFPFLRAAGCQEVHGCQHSVGGVLFDARLRSELSACPRGLSPGWICALKQLTRPAGVPRGPLPLPQPLGRHRRCVTPAHGVDSNRHEVRCLLLAPTAFVRHSSRGPCESPRNRLSCSVPRASRPDACVSHSAPRSSRPSAHFLLFFPRRREPGWSSYSANTQRAAREAEQRTSDLQEAMRRVRAAPRPAARALTAANSTTLTP